MRRRILMGLALMSAVVACSASGEDGGEADDSNLTAKNLGRQDFGLQDHELILTLDDGPGPRTKELVDWLVENKVPAVFFEMGNNAKARPDAMNYVAEHSKDVPGGLIIGNHSLTHTTPLPQQGVAGSIKEIMVTDGIIGDAMKKAQMQFPTQIPFFRPPYGAFTALGAAKIDEVNKAGAAKYVGPIFWEIGGELTDQFSADWACWSKVSLERCRAGYMAEANLRKKGIILCHDIHSKTIDMLTGTGEAKGVSMIKELQKQGFKFVGLRSHEPAVQAFADAQRREKRDVLATSERKDDGTVEVTVDLGPAGASHGAVIFDGDDKTKQSVKAQGTVKKKLNPGQHRITIVALGANEEVLAQKELGLVVPADIVDGQTADTADHAPCVNYSHLTLHRPFKLFIKKVECGTEGAAEAVPGECYKFNGTVRVAAAADGQHPAVRATGGNEWSIEYDLSFANDPNDLSKLSLVLETGTGHIITGKRHAFKNAAGKPAANRADVPFVETKVDCSEGVWRGTFNYTNGTQEEFLFRKPSANEPEFNER